MTRDCRTLFPRSGTVRPGGHPDSHHEDGKASQKALQGGNLNACRPTRLPRTRGRVAGLAIGRQGPSCAGGAPRGSELGKAGGR